MPVTPDTVTLDILEVGAPVTVPPGTGNGIIAVYDVRLTPEGHIECDCPGHTRWGRCRHRQTLQAAGLLPG